MNIFNKARQKKKRRASANDVPPNDYPNVYLGPKRRSSQDTLVYNRFDPTQEHYGQLANNLSSLNRTLNNVLRDVMNSDNSSPSIGANLRNTRRSRSMGGGDNNNNNEDYENDSDDTAASIDSLLISGFKIFGKNIDQYNAKRTMPIVSLTLKAGQLLFPSQQSVDHYKKSHKWRLTRSMERSASSSSGSNYHQNFHQQSNGRPELRSSISEESVTTSNDSSAIIDDDDEEGDEMNVEYEEDSDLPLFYMFSPPLLLFRKNCPYLVISKYFNASELRQRLRQRRRKSMMTPQQQVNDSEEPSKYVFCKAYDKYLKAGIKRFILEFFPNPDKPEESFKVVMFTHRSKPYTDALYKGTKLRFVGTSVCTSVFRSSAIQLMIMNEPNAISLMDNMTADDKPDPANPLLKEETTMTDMSGGAINYKLYGNSTLPPMAKFTDNNYDLLPKKFNKLGFMYCYELINLQNRDEVYGDYHNVKQVKFDTMVITCMLLVLREQESKKNPRNFNSQLARGVPYYGNTGTAGLYGSYGTPYSLGSIW